MKNKKWFPLGILAIVLLVGAGGVWTYQYWKEGTPEYSLVQLDQAIAQHNSTIALQYLNTGSIWNNFLPRFESLYSSSNNSNPFLNIALSLAASSTQQTLNTDVYESITGESTTTPPILSIVKGLSGKTFVIHGSVATVATSIEVASSSFPIIVVFEQESNRSWQITDIQGLEKVFVTILSQQNQPASVEASPAVSTGPNGASATIDPSSLYSSSSTPTIAGTFSDNNGGIEVEISSQPLSKNDNGSGIVYSDSSDHGGDVQLSTYTNSSGTYSDTTYEAIPNGTYYLGIYQVNNIYNSNGFVGDNNYLLTSAKLTVQAP
jgi:hypothetical protein